MKTAALGLLFCLLAPLSASADDEYREQRIKTAFLVNFARLTVWPPETFASPGAPLELCIDGGAGFDAVLGDLAKNPTVNGRPLHLSRVSRPADLQRCNVVYLQDAATAATILSGLSGRHVLTVYEGEVTQTYGVIRFYLEQDRLRFEINQGAARREGLQFSEKLVGLARIVEQ